MSTVMEELESRVGAGKRAKAIRHAMMAHRTGINAPHKEDLPEEQHGHFYESRWETERTGMAILRPIHTQKRR